MPPARFVLDSRILLPALVVVGLGLAGCVGEGPGKSVAEATGLATTPQESKPFVQASRAPDVDYIPVGRGFGKPALCKNAATPPPGPTTVRGKTATFVLVQTPATADCTPAAPFKTIEAELEAKRVSNDAAGVQARALGATPPPKPAVLPTN